jgi:chorismate-pyruvate lyase
MEKSYEKTTPPLIRSRCTLVSTNSPTLESLFAALPHRAPVPRYRYVSSSEIPEPYRHLLVHDRHMTVAMETHHLCKVKVRVLQSCREDGWYARQIVLAKENTQQVVLGGIVRIHLSMLDEEVQAGILSEGTPLGHVLIDHEVLRHIEVQRYLVIDGGPAMAVWPGFERSPKVYGRLGILHCDCQPAIELFEILP